MVYRQHVTTSRGGILSKPAPQMFPAYITVVKMFLNNLYDDLADVVAP